MASAIVSSGAQDAGAKGGAAQAFVIVFSVISVRSQTWLQICCSLRGGWLGAARFGIWKGDKQLGVSQIIYHAAGSPSMQSGKSGVCRVCGGTSDGIGFSGWVRDTFTDHDKLLPGEIICQSCQFCFDEASPLLTERAGKEKLQRMRNYSHFVVDGEWLPLSKGQKTEMLEALRSNPSVAIIAESGQKHIIFRAQPGWWQFEESSMLPNLPALEALLSLTQEMYQVFSKDEIATGNYDQRRIMEFGINRFLRVEQEVRKSRGSLPFNLAIYLTQKGDEDGRLPEGVSSSTQDSDPALAGTKWGVQAQVRPQHLGAVRGEHSQRSVHKQPEQVRQQSLFEIAD